MLSVPTFDLYRTDNKTSQVKCYNFSFPCIQERNDCHKSAKAPICLREEGWEKTAPKYHYRKRRTKQTIIRVEGRQKTANKA